MGKRNTFSPIGRLRGSFSLKLAVLFCIVLVIIATFGGLIYMQTGAALEKSTKDNMERSTVLQANTISEWVERTEEKTRHLSAADPVLRGDESEIESFLREERAESAGSIAAIHYFDANDRTVIGSSEDGVSTSAYADASVEWVTEGIATDEAGHVTVTHPYHDPVADVPAVAFVSSVPDDPDRVIVVVVDLETQTNQLERPSVSEGAFTHVVDSRGTVVMSHDKGDINTQNMGGDAELSVESMAVKRGIRGETGYLEMEMDAHGMMAMGYAPIPETNWVVMTHIPAEAAYALQDDITQSVLALVAFSLLGLGLIGAIVGRNTSRSIGRLVEQTEKLEDGDLDAELETSRSDEIGRLYDAFDSMRVSLREQIEEVERARQRAEQARDETTRLNRHLEQKADEYRTVMRECAEGDLTRRLDPESESEAMSDIAVEFNEMIAELEETTEQLSQFATAVAAASEEVTAGTEEVHSASEQVAGSIQEIADGAERQNENLQTIDAEMDGLSTTTEEIASSSNEVATLARRTAETGRTGRETAQNAIEGMGDISDESERAVAEIERLETEIEQIDELVESIGEVAEQTNMLALNANIEASRSANSGEGFSAVASEVKELAEETKVTAEDIENRIEAIKTQTGRTAEGVQRTSQQIADHREAVAEAVEALEEIARYAAETNDGVQEISAATEQQAASTQEVVSMIDEVSTISRETTNEAETVAAAGEEQTTALTEITHSANTLSQQASELSSKLDEFETDADIDLDRSFSADTIDVRDEGSAFDDLLQDRNATEGDESNADTDDRPAQSESGADRDDVFTFVDSTEADDIPVDDSDQKTER
ncbi:methyl-accepting chemotaxis protein [Halosolutus gelatinilyticus]|uniref:methyl-accepting chemotaxis protein n=1 Tax=Halosolutus gelatinilyticus TaxID=2931975 RepID=UPI001FF6E215|nr:methyl-accepting chemotaxis protein [Halosolutus gelatinilyticus]